MNPFCKKYYLGVKKYLIKLFGTIGNISFIYKSKSTIAVYDNRLKYNSNSFKDLEEI